MRQILNDLPSDYLTVEQSEIDLSLNHCQKDTKNASASLRTQSRTHTQAHAKYTLSKAHKFTQTHTRRRANPNTHALSMRVSLESLTALRTVLVKWLRSSSFRRWLKSVMFSLLRLRSSDCPLVSVSLSNLPSVCASTHLCQSVLYPSLPSIQSSLGQSVLSLICPSI